MIGLSTSVSKSSARKVFGCPATGINGCRHALPGGGQFDAHLVPAVCALGQREKGGATFSIAKADSTQLLRTVISRL